MSVIYENKVKAMGECVNEFNDEKLLIIFGDNAPEEIADYCYSVDVNPINGEIKAGQFFEVDDERFQITAVGWEAPTTLAGLGHCTFKFNGATEPDQPGTICVEDKEMPELKIGTVLRIVEG